MARPSRRKRPGVVPTIMWKLVVRWLWLANPTAIAISAIEWLDPSRSSLARRTRCSIKYRCGASPILCRKDLPK